MTDNILKQMIINTKYNSIKLNKLFKDSKIQSFEFEHL